MSERDCMECGATVKAVFPQTMFTSATEPERVYFQGENAWHLDFSGHYGGFNDAMGQDPMILLCHDCCVRLVEAFPNAFRHLDGGRLHPFDVTEEPCCKWGWTTTPEYGWTE